MTVFLSLLGWGCHKDPEPDDPIVTAPPYETRPANPTCLAPPRPPGAGPLTYTAVAQGLIFDKATLAIQPPDAGGTWWVLHQDGRVVAFDEGVQELRTVLDIRDRVESGPDEAGLLSLALHPGWAQNREVIVSYTAEEPFRSVVSRFRSPDGGQTLDPSSEQQIFTIDQPFYNHNGGHVAFGHDGYLYLGLGDGGSGGDPLGSGQDTDSLLGKILRLDIDGGSPYAIPADNPFAQGGGRPEIYAWGLRNPWRFSFDPASEDLWVGDVGQDKYEEVDLVRRGGNYGWNTMEGEGCFATTECDTEGLVLPVAYTDQADGDQSVTGGVVYRGLAMPELQGTYVWGDYGSGRLYGLVLDPVTGETERTTLVETGLNITHIGTDAQGEIVIVDRYAGLFRVVPAEPPPATSSFPETLSETGCFDPQDPNRPLPMLIPYEVAHPFWSDGADKARWLAIPDGTVLSFDAQGEVVFPPGSVLVKEFTVGGRKLETRLLVLHDDGVWAGYPYVWNEAGTDAILDMAGVEIEAPGQRWAVPSRQQCLQCHTVGAGGTLGLSLPQLDVVATYPSGARENQVDLLVRLGMAEEPSERPGAWPDRDDPAATLEDRARTYLDVNCAFCHYDGGTGGGELDLRKHVPLEQTQLCEPPQEGDLGFVGSNVVVPGQPQASILAVRMRLRDTYGMPPVGSLRVDTDGAELIEQWIASLESCP
jgi:uncharacterized repeat protein (TIGR03806 family)